MPFSCLYCTSITSMTSIISCFYWLSKNMKGKLTSCKVFGQTISPLSNVSPFGKTNNFISRGILKTLVFVFFSCWFCDLDSFSSKLLRSKLMVFDNLSFSDKDCLIFRSLAQSSCCFCTICSCVWKCLIQFSQNNLVFKVNWKAINLAL